MPRYTVALGVRPPAQPADSGAAFNPIATMEGLARTQNEFNQIRLQNETFAARLHLGQVFSSAKDFESGMEALRQDPAISFFPEMLTQARQADLAMVQTAHERQQMGTSTFENFQKLMPELYQDPTKWDTIKATVLANTQDPKVRAANEAQLEAYHSAMFDGTGGDVGKIRQNMMGGMLSWMTPEQSKLYTGSYEQQDIGGGSSQLIYKPGIFSSEPEHAAAPPIVGGRGPTDITGRTQVIPPIVGGMAGTAAPPGALSAPGMAGYGAPVGPGTGYMPPGSQTYTPPTAAPAPAQPPAAAAPNLVTGGALGIPAGQPAPGSEGGAAPSSIQLPQVNVGAQAPPAGQPPGTMTFGVGLTEAADREKKMAEYESDLDNNVAVGQGLRKNMDEIYEAAKQVHLGGGAEGFMRFAKALQALGVNNDTIDKWAGGGLAPLTVIDKLSLQNATGQMRTQLETGRYNRNEFVAFLNSNPGITTDPRAMVQVFNLWNQYFQKNQAEQQALNTAKNRQGFDITRWPAQWAGSDYMKKFAPSTTYTGEGVLGVLPEKARDGVFLPRNKQEFDELPKGARYRKPGWGADQSDIK